MKYVALFRGINVGGKHVVKMEDLKALLSDLGAEHVKTYIQSGNAVFESDSEAAHMTAAIQTAFAERFGFESRVMLRTDSEMTSLIASLPISQEAIEAAEAIDPKTAHLYVYFLDQMPETEAIVRLCEAGDDGDLLVAGNRALYLLCHQSIRKSKLAVRTAKVFSEATVRNWKTVKALDEMFRNL
jgi:uncharacterized protein (DUF1697 family)